MLQIIEAIPYQMKEVELQKIPINKQTKVLHEIIKQSSKLSWHDTFFAVHNSQIVGAISFEHYNANKTTYICDIAVAQHHRGEEVKAKLIEAVLCAAKQRNQEAVRFHHIPIDPTYYQNMGFTINITMDLTK